MKKVWYLYKNGFNFGQRDDGIKALSEIADLTGKNLPIIKSIILAKGYYKCDEYEAKLEELK